MIVPVLLAGGSGTRLWPLSREAYPKQFLRLGHQHSLLQQAVLRSRQIAGASAPVVVCGEQHRFIVAEQLRELGIDGATIILEPEGRNTAPAAAVAALHVRARHGDAALAFVMSADQAIADVEAFCAAVEAGAHHARADRLMVFGIRPTRAETGFGYLKRGQPLGHGAFALAAFVEKPDAETAARFLADGTYAWNGGLFLFSVDTFLRELTRFEPAMVAACEAALTGAKADLDFIRLGAAAFRGARSESIDYALMEKTDKAALIPLDAGWDDVGSWSYLGTMPTDAQGNYARGDVLLEDSQSTLIHAEDRLVAALGLKDIIVVETSDAVLVAARDRVQEVRKLVARLKDAQRPEVNVHTVVHRPWGSYETIAEGPRFQVKRIIVKPQHKLSLQLHHHRAEHWVVVCGTAAVTCGEQNLTLTENQSVYIPVGTKHRLENPGLVPLELIEVQSGGYLGEDDIIRFDDVYGRVSG